MSPRTTAAERHEVWVAQMQTGLYFGKCACGWEGPTRDATTTAADEARDHRRDALAAKAEP